MKSVTLTNGDVVQLRYDFSALTRLEEEAGINVFDKNSLKRLSPARLRDLAWAGLLIKLPELSRAEAATLIDLNNLEELSAAVVEAMEQAMPKNAPKKQR